MLPALCCVQLPGYFIYLPRELGTVSWLRIYLTPGPDIRDGGMQVISKNTVAVAVPAAVAAQFDSSESVAQNHLGRCLGMENLWLLSVGGKMRSSLPQSTSTRTLRKDLTLLLLDGTVPQP